MTKRVDEVIYISSAIFVLTTTTDNAERKLNHIFSQQIRYDTRIRSRGSKEGVGYLGQFGSFVNRSRRRSRFTR